ncbi:MAG: ribosome-associated translation inhibitor RaiA [Lentisphaeraceae bacterium]|nr:ribosome-associated translation inhibitor RaiA [Lentisphaeraceae bacterium]
MRVTMNAKPMKVTEAMKAAVMDNIHHLDHYKRLQRAEVLMRTENHTHVAEIILHGGKLHLYAKAKAKDMYKALKEAVKKVDHQLRRKVK